MSEFELSEFELSCNHFGVVDEEKKKVLGIFYGRFLSNLVEGGHGFFTYFKGAMPFLVSLKGAISKKDWETLI